MDPVLLALKVEGEGFEALMAGLRDRITTNSIFIETDQPIAPKTRVVVEVCDQTGRMELRGDGSVADVRTEGSAGVLVAVEWEEQSRSIVDRILTGDMATPSQVEHDQAVPPGESWADALLTGAAPSLPPPPPQPKPVVEAAPPPVRATQQIQEPPPPSEPPPPVLDGSWVPPEPAGVFESIDLDFGIDSDDIDIPTLSETGLVETEDVPSAPKVDPAALPTFDVKNGGAEPMFVASGDIVPIEEDFQQLIDETIGDDASAEAVVHGRSTADAAADDDALVAPALDETAGPPPTGFADDLRVSELDRPRTDYQAPPPPTPPPPPVQEDVPVSEHLVRAVGDLGPKGEAIIGIDLGTTYSCAAIVENGEARVLATRRGKPTIASVVFYDQSGRTFVGETAVKKGEVEPQRMVIGSKRLMGRPYHSPLVQEVMGHFAYPIVQGYAGQAAIRMDDRIVALEEVAAEILRELREAASLQVDGRLNRAVITCPAYFNERQREAVRVAGEIAGFHVERVLNEPTAAALHYGFGKGLDARRVLVYDLGGGTFDVSLLEITGEVYEVLATGGDSFLGGIDFDACVAEMLAEAFVEQEHIDPREDPAAVARLLQYAEAAKRDLSTMVTTIVQIDHLVVQPYAARSITVALKQKRAERAFEPLVEQTLRVVVEVCERAGASIWEVDDILLVGGQTRTPLVRRRVAEVFGKQPLSSVHPDYAVALGAAQYAATLDSFDSIVLIDALPISIGVGLPGGRMKKIVERDTRLPVQRKYRLHTTRDNQRNFEILVFQGEGDWVQNNEPLGMLLVPNLPKGPRGSVSVDVELEVNEECILRLSATETKSGKKVEAQFGTKDTPEDLRRKLGLPDTPTHAEMERMKEEANRPKGVWRWLTGLFSGG